MVRLAPLCAAIFLGAALFAGAQGFGSVDLGKMKKIGAGSGEISGASASVFDIRFAAAPVSPKPDHGHRNPGPRAFEPDGRPVIRAGYTLATIKKKMEIEWGDGGTQDGKFAFYAEKIKIRYTLDQEVYVSSDYAEGSCPYEVTKEHELGHAKAFLKIFRESEEGLRRILEESAEKTTEPHSPPRIGTKLSPAMLEPTSEAVARYQSRLNAKITKIIDAHRNYAMGMLELDRNAKDAPDAYAKDYARCPASDWQPSTIR